MSSTIAFVVKSFQRIEKAFLFSLFGKTPHPALCFLPTVTYESPDKRASFSIQDIIGDGFLFAVPKHRTTIERRLKKKFGWPKYVWKLLKPKKLLSCNECGHAHEVGILCPNCFKINMEETKAMQDQIQSELGLSPIDKEVIVLYEGEKLEKAEEFWRNKRVVEMPKERPHWFSKNLLQKTTQKPATSTDIQPTELA